MWDSLGGVGPVGTGHSDEQRQGQRAFLRGQDDGLSQETAQLSHASHPSCLFTWHSSQIRAMTPCRAGNSEWSPARRVCVRPGGWWECLEQRLKTTQGRAARALAPFAVLVDLAKSALKPSCPSRNLSESWGPPHSPVHLWGFSLDFGAGFHHLFGNFTTAKKTETQCLCTDVRSGSGGVCALFSFFFKLHSSLTQL